LIQLLCLLLYRCISQSSDSVNLTISNFPKVRKQVYIVGNSEPRENIGVLNELIDARDELAKIMGCKSYAEFAIRPNMAASADVVMSFLGDLSNIVRHKADEEFKAIQDFKRRICYEKSADLEPWDEDFFIGMMKSSLNNLDASVCAN